MAEWSRDKFDSAELNGGQEYTNNDNFNLSAFNKIVNGNLYTQDFAEHLADTPDVSDADKVGTPQVSLVDTVVNGKAYKKFKFSFLKGATGKFPTSIKIEGRTYTVTYDDGTTDSATIDTSECMVTEPISAFVTAVNGKTGNVDIGEISEIFESDKKTVKKATTAELVKDTGLCVALIYAAIKDNEGSTTRYIAQFSFSFIMPKSMKSDFESMGNNESNFFAFMNNNSIGGTFAASGIACDPSNSYSGITTRFTIVKGINQWSLAYSRNIGDAVSESNLIKGLGRAGDLVIMSKNVFEIPNAVNSAEA